MTVRPKKLFSDILPNTMIWSSISIRAKILMYSISVIDRDSKVFTLNLFTMNWSLHKNMMS